MENKPLSHAEKNTILSKKRTSYSALRTLLAFVHTSIVILSLAIAFIKIEKEHPINALTITLFILSAVFLALGILQYFLAKKHIKDL